MASILTYFRISFVVLALAISSAVAQAQERLPHGPIEAEIHQLPSYCQAKLGDDPNTQRIWSQRLGKGWGSLHHYCFGINFINRVEAVMHDPRERRFNLNQARAEFNYVLRHWPAEFPLRGEAEKLKALTETMLNQR